MERVSFTASSGNRLSYGIAPGPAPWVCLMSGIGMGRGWWYGLLDELRGRHGMIHVEYRGFPDAERALAERELEFPAYVEDTHEILRRAGIGAAFLVSWCAGTKVAVEYAAAHPEVARGIFTVNMAYVAVSGEVAESRLDRFMSEASEQLLRRPQAAASIAATMRRLQLVPTLAEIRAAKGAPVREEEFYYFLRPLEFRNFATLYPVFRRKDVLGAMRALACPVHAIAGNNNTFISIENIRRAGAYLRDFRYVEIDGGTHFMLLDRHAEIASIIARGIDG